MLYFWHMAGLAVERFPRLGNTSMSKSFAHQTAHPRKEPELWFPATGQKGEQFYSSFFTIEKNLDEITELLHLSRLC
jgi:hypothetical protein